MSTVHLYVIRHGQTQHNLEELLQGSGVDAPLNQTGEIESRAAGLYIRKKAIRFKRIFCSPLLRTRQTLEHILTHSEHDSDYHHSVDPRLVECCYGVCEGQHRSVYDQLRSEWTGEPHEFKAPGGESRSELFSRVSNWLDDLLLHSEAVGEHENWLVVSHGGTISALTALIHGQLPHEPSKYRFHNTGLTIFEVYQKNVQMLIANSLEHLNEKEF